MINEQLGLDDLVRKFKGYVLGENGFDELDFKEAILELIKEEKIKEMNLLMNRYTAIARKPGSISIMPLIVANRIKEIKEEL